MSSEHRQLCLGWVTDKEFISIPSYMIMAYLLQGVSMIALPFTDDLAVFMVLLACYSINASSILVRLPVILLRNVRTDQHSLAVGCYGFISGLVPFASPFMIGHFRDKLGSYDGMYYTLGGLSIASACVWFLEPVLTRWNRSLEETRLSKLRSELA